MIYISRIRCGQRFITDNTDIMAGAATAGRYIVLHQLTRKTWIAVQQAIHKFFN
jgi:hypothetical protein